MWMGMMGQSNTADQVPLVLASTGTGVGRPLSEETPLDELVLEPELDPLLELELELEPELELAPELEPEAPLELPPELEAAPELPPLLLEPPDPPPPPQAASNASNAALTGNIRFFIIPPLGLPPILACCPSPNCGAFSVMLTDCICCAATAVVKHRRVPDVRHRKRQGLVLAIDAHDLHYLLLR